MTVPSPCTSEPPSDSVRLVIAVPAVMLGRVVLLLIISVSSAFQLNAAADVSLSVRLTLRSPASWFDENFQPTTSNSFALKPYRALVMPIISPTSTSSASKLKSALKVICSRPRNSVSLASLWAVAELVVKGSCKSSSACSPLSSVTNAAPVTSG